MNSFFSQFTHQLSKSRFFQSIFILAGGTALAQALGVLFSPLLSRLYTPEDFGSFAFYISVLSVLLVISSLRYELAIPLPGNEANARALLALALLILLLLSGLCWFCVALFGDFFVDWFQVPLLLPYIWLLPLSLLGAGFYQVFNYWAVRMKTYAPVSTTRLVQSGTQVGLQLFLGWKILGPFGLLLGDAGGRLFAGATLGYILRGRSLLGGLSLRLLVAVGKEYRRFPLLMSWAAVCNTLALQAPFLMLPGLFNPVIAGLFFFGHRILVLPASLINRAVSQVFFGEAAGSFGDNNALKTLSLRLTLTLLAIYLPFYGGILLVAQDLFSLLFGETWTTAGYYAQILAPMVLFWSIASPLSSLLVVGNRLKESLLFTIVELIFKIGSILIGSAFESFEMTLVLMAGSGLVLCLFSIWRFLRVVKTDFFLLLRKSCYIFIINIPFYFCLLLLSQLGAGYYSLGGFILLVPMGIFFSLRYLNGEIV